MHRKELEKAGTILQQSLLLGEIVKSGNIMVGARELQMAYGFDKADTEDFEAIKELLNKMIAKKNTQLVDMGVEL